MISIRKNESKSRSDLQKIKNCLGYIAYSQRLKNTVLQEQAKKLIKELFLGSRIGQRWRATRATAEVYTGRGGRV